MSTMACWWCVVLVLGLVRITETNAAEYFQPNSNSYTVYMRDGPGSEYNTLWTGNFAETYEKVGSTVASGGSYTHLMAIGGPYDGRNVWAFTTYLTSKNVQCVAKGTPYYNTATTSIINGNFTLDGQMMKVADTSSSGRYNVRTAGGPTHGTLTYVSADALRDCENEECRHIARLDDTWGDGWNGNYLEVYVNDVKVLDVTVPSGGYNRDYLFYAKVGDTIRFEYIKDPGTGNSYPEENKWSLLDRDWNFIFQDLIYDGGLGELSKSTTAVCDSSVWNWKTTSCADYPCDPQVTCTAWPTAPLLRARTCGVCPTGSEGFGFENAGYADYPCTQINECLEASRCGCDPLAPCNDLPVGCECGACPAGFSDEGEACTSSADYTGVVSKTTSGRDCQQWSSQTPHAHAFGSVGQHNYCRDPDGTGTPWCYTTDVAVTRENCAVSCPGGQIGTTCLDRNECVETANGGCAPEVACENTPGSFSCPPCPAGYTGDSTVSCDNIDECASNNGGCGLRSCVDGPGSWTCGACPPGYNDDGLGGCQDVDECLSGNGGCDSDATCTNTPGSRTCACNPGFEGDGLTCTDIVDCPGACDPNRGCSDTPPGSFTCAADCNTGFRLNADGVTCDDINECDEGGFCDPLVTCANTVGSYTCTACPAGYTGDGYVSNGGCTDVDECVSSPCSVLTDCVNYDGDYLCSPYIKTNSLTTDGGTVGAFPFVPTSTAAGERVQMDVDFDLAAGITLSGVFYGPTGDRKRYECTNPVLEAQGGANHRLRCDLAFGVGNPLRFSLKYCFTGLGCTLSTKGVDELRYPAPTITNTTLRQASLPGTGSTLLVAPNTQGLEVAFEGTNFHNLDMTVTYGPDGALDRYPCQLSSSSTSTLVKCIASADTSSEGTNQLAFRVTHINNGGQADGTDRFVVPRSATVTSISGCSLSDGDGTAGCPTAGGEMLELVGTEFGVGDKPKVLVNGRDCPVEDGHTDTQLMCELPPGAGANQLVLVITQTQFSRPVPLVSYEPPTVTKLASDACYGKNGNTALTRCTRQGTPRVLTIEGANFGADSAQVVVGSFTCDQVEHDSVDPHGKLTCVLQAGSGVDLPVLVVQGNGGASAIGSASLSFTPCDPGEYSDGLTCRKCLAGKFSSLASLGCTACHTGEYSDADGSSACSSCEAGKFSPEALDSSAGFTQCSNCSDGFFTAATRQASCERCPSGTFALAGATECTNCPVGQFQRLAGQSFCEDCDPGLYQNVEGGAECLACPPGRASNQSRTELCTECEPGLAQSNPGQESCSVCSAGFFSSSRGAVTCTPCAAGRFSGSEQSTECDACEAGRHQPSSRGTECLACAPGTYTSASGRSECLLCDKGTYADQNASTTCTVCAPGTSQPDVAGATCVDCEVGKFTNARGQLRCSSCPPGSYTSIEGQRACVPCPRGEFQVLSGQASCEKCAPASYSNVQGQSSCLRCEAGQYQNASGATTCDVCSNGTFSALVEGSGATSCTPCPINAVSPRNGADACIPCLLGSTSPNIGGSECAPCDAGRYQADTSSFDCLPCPAGSAQREIGSSKCELCLKGTFAAANGTSECLPCAPGRVQPVDGGRECSPCPPGTRESQGLNCIKCGDQRVAPWEGSSECILCPAGAKPNLEATQCQCAAGSFLVLNGDEQGEDSTIDCQPCPKGSRCSEDGVTSETIEAEEGFWRQDDGSYKRCQNAEHCKGGINSTCGTLRGGPLCAVCAPGTRDSVSDPTCKPCPSQGNAWGTSIGFSILIIVGLSVLYYMVLRSGQVDNAKALDASEAVLENGETLLLTAENRLKPTFTYNLKIVLGFLQICSSLVRMVEIPWPPAYRTFVSYFNIVNLDFIPWNSVRCVATLDFYERFLIVTLVPAGLIGIIGGIAATVLFLLKRCDMSDNDARRNKFNRWKHNCIRLFLFTLFLLYPAVSTNVLQYFVCDEINGVDYLVAGVPLQCFDSKWLNFLPPGLGMLLLYPIGIPLFFFIVLFKHRKNLRDQGVTAAYGFLFEAYHPDQWYFELVDMGHKLFLTALVVFFPIDIQLPACLVVSLAYTLVLLTQRPYIRMRDDRMHLLAQAEIYLILCAAYTLRVTEENGPDKTMSVLISIALIGVIVLLCAAFVYHVALYVRVLLWNRKRKKHRDSGFAGDGDTDAGLTDAGTSADHTRRRSGLWDSQGSISERGGELNELQKHRRSSAGSGELASEFELNPAVASLGDRTSLGPSGAGSFEPHGAASFDPPPGYENGAYNSETGDAYEDFAANIREGEESAYYDDDYYE